MPEKTILFDIRGQVCPSALLLALRELNRLHGSLIESGQTLEIRTDHRDATGTIPAAARNMGFQSQVEKHEGAYRILLWHERDGGGAA